MEKKIILILLAGYVLDNSYRFIQELFLLATDRVNTFAFIPELLIPEVVKYLVECFFMYAWLMNAMRTGTLAFKNTASLLLFSGLLFLVRATVGTFIFIFLYALLFEFIPPLPVLLGYPLPQDLWSIYFKPLQYAGLTIFSTWICVKLSCLVFRRTQRLKLAKRRKKISKNHAGSTE